MAEVKTIKVGGNQVGLVGLAEALEELARAGVDPGEPGLGARLVERLSVANYIAGPAREKYAAALTREYHRHLGLAVTEERAAGLEVLILGQGCPRCHDLHSRVLATLERLGLPARVEEVTNPAVIRELGVSATPALVVDGRVVAAGAPPNDAQLTEILGEARQGRYAPLGLSTAK
ncbi:MAG: thioredoxin family protein [Deltaproteobacteria bacterium]|nr:thioredoxin family protein [Deltaproteobacteria bacterium]